jgi:primosomal protein N' (replication factor Y)
VEVLGPAEAPLALLRGRYRYRLLVRAPRSVPLQDIMAEWLGGVPVEGSVRRAVDIDPQSFL